MRRDFQSAYASRDGRSASRRDRLVRLGETGPERLRDALLYRMLGTLEHPGRRPHPVADNTVILLGFPEPHDDAHPKALHGLRTFLRGRHIRRLNSGWRTEGYAVTFRADADASEFRRGWAGETVVPVSRSMASAFDLVGLSARIAELSYA